MLPVDLQSEADHWLMYATPIMNVNYLYRFNVSPVDEYSSTHEKVQLSIVIIIHNLYMYINRPHPQII